jgi:hypothetical protein
MEFSRQLDWVNELTVLQLVRIQKKVIAPVQFDVVVARDFWRLPRI